MIHCKNCGAELPDFACFCTACGSEVAPKPADSFAEPSSEQPEQDTKSNPVNNQGYDSQNNSAPNQGYNPQFNGAPNQGYNPQFNGASNQGYNPQFNGAPNQGYNPQFNGAPNQGFGMNYMNPNYYVSSTLPENGTFTGALRLFWSNFANFKGRARRSEYWFATLWNFIFSLIPFVGWFYAIAAIIPSLSLTWRRLHDIGKSGAFYFISFIPFIGWIFMLVWGCTDSEPCDNQYGPYPKGNVFMGGPINPNMYQQ